MAVAYKKVQKAVCDTVATHFNLFICSDWM